MTEDGIPIVRAQRGKGRRSRAAKQHKRDTAGELVRSRSYARRVRHRPPGSATY